MDTSLKIRDRIRELRRVRAGDLLPNEKNWRTHPAAQREAIAGILQEVGYVDALLVRELDGGRLQILDGHLRAETTPDSEVPVLVVDLDDSEAAKVLATFDPLAALAEADSAKLDALLREVDTGSEALQEMLADLAKEAGLYGAPEVNEPAQQESAPADTEADALLAKWNVQPGQQWRIRSKTGMGEHRIVCGDSGAAANLPRCDGVCTDPPYEIEPRDCANTMKRFADVAVVLCADALAFALAKAWQMRLDMIWVHRTPKKLPNRNVPIIYHAHILVLAVSDATKTGWQKPTPEFGSVIRTEQEYVSQHGHGKSAELFRAMLAGFSWRAVADPYLGSGAALIACEQEGRLCLGFEREPRWVAVALERAARFGLSPQVIDSQEDTAYNTVAGGAETPPRPKHEQAEKEPADV